MKNTKVSNIIYCDLSTAYTLVWATTYKVEKEATMVWYHLEVNG